MIFSYNWLQTFFKTKLPKPKKLAELFTLRSFEVERIEKKANDWILDIDITPNRADCFSHLGLAKECEAILKLKIQTPKTKVKTDKKIKIDDLVKVKVENKIDCPRYSGIVILGVRVAPSPSWLQERLLACNLLPINNIVDAVNYIMLETGQPLHAFDLEKISGPKPKEIIVRRAKKGEKIQAIDEKIYNLGQDILVIADKKHPIAIAGIKGGKETQITQETKNIFIESANFNPVIIRKASQKLKLKTDASFRFEHSLDPNLTTIALKKAADLIIKIASGKLALGMIDFYPQKIKPWTIKLNFKKIEHVLGIKISKKEVLDILKRLGFEIKKKKDQFVNVQIPTRRRDLLIEEDLIEEIGRIYGYEKIKPLPPAIWLSLPEKEPHFIWQSKIRRILKEAKMIEVYNYSFIGEKDKEKFNLKNIIEIENPISNEFRYLRPSLLINLIKNIERNQKNFDQFELFEIGKVFYLKNKKVQEKKMLSGIVFGPKEGFLLVKGILDTLLEGLGISDYFYDDYQPSFEGFLLKVWHPQKSANLVVANKKIGILGQISRKISHLYDIKKEVFAFEIDFEELIKLAQEEQEYLPILKYPAVIRDIAILVPEKTKVAQVLNVIYSAGGKLLRDVDLFDLYFGQEIPQGKKNLAFHLIFQSETKTLSSKEVDKLMEKIIKAIEKNIDWEVRR